MGSILIYLTIGIIWSAWLEHFCSTNLEEPYNYDFTVTEKLFHIGLWPLSLSSFIYFILKDFFK